MSVEANNIRTEHSVIEQFTADMRANGIHIDEPIVADGKRHRYYVEGDKRGRRNAWAVLHIDDHPAGMYGYWKTGEKFRWSMKGGKPMSKAERAQLRDQSRLRAANRKAEIALWQYNAAARALHLYDQAAPVQSHAYLSAKGVPTTERLRVGNWYRIDTETGEEILVSDSALLVPIMDTQKTIHSIQAIIPDDRESSGFRKQYLKDGAKEGKFMAIGLPKNDIVLICEGLATGLSLWQCTSHAVLVAFDAGNLIHVARAIRRARPHFRIILCADNDAWTLKPIENPGLHYARLAAHAVSGVVAMPEFLRTESKPTDFNDLHKLEGELIVQDIINAAIAPPAESLSVEETPLDNDFVPHLPMAVPPGPKDEDYDGPSRNEYFSILGYDHGTYYIYSYMQGQVLDYTHAGFTDTAFLELATANWWEEHFPGDKGMNRKMAQEFLMHTANKKGIFNPNRVRGRGAWFDRGRSVFHHGQYLTVDGVKTDISRMKSGYTYELAEALTKPADSGLTDAEGINLLSLASQFRWKMKGSAPLLCGWIALAPLCGALQWRPHIWLTGNAGSGKSTILESFVHAMLNSVDPLYVGGNSTEAGIRQTLKADARPVLFDESESNEERDVTRMQSVLALMRSSSSESQARTVKGTMGGASMYFQIRSMFCLASIQVGAKHQADHERLSVLTLLPKLTTSQAADQWDALKERIYSMITADPTISARLFRRSIDMLPTILKNIDVFRGAAARIFKSQRAGDQYGTLLAGCFALVSTKEATKEDAEYFVNAYDWREHVEETDNDEGQRLMSGLLEAHIRAPGGIDLTVFEVLSVANGMYRSGVEIDSSTAIALLARYGMKIVGDHLMLSNQSNALHLLMSSTDFKADWRGVLLRIPGVDRNENKPVRINGATTKVTRLNLTLIFEDEEKRVPVRGKESEQTPY